MSSWEQARHRLIVEGIGPTDCGAVAVAACVNVQTGTQLTIPEVRRVVGASPSGALTELEIVVALHRYGLAIAGHTTRDFKGTDYEEQAQKCTCPILAHIIRGAGALRRRETELAQYAEGHKLLASTPATESWKLALEHLQSRRGPIIFGVNAHLLHEAVSETKRFNPFADGHWLVAHHIDAEWAYTAEINPYDKVPLEGLRRAYNSAYNGDPSLILLHSHR